MTSGPVKSPRWSGANLRAAIDAAGVALWAWNVDTDRITMDRRAFELWGIVESDDVAFGDLSACIHPADLDKVRASFAATRAVKGAYEIDFRILVNDEIRWISARGQGCDEEIPGGRCSGFFST